MPEPDYKRLGTKCCNACKKTLPVGAFTVDRSRADGLDSNCRACNKIRYQTMKLRKEQVRVNGLTGVIRKVYDAVPMQTPWNAHEIGQELFRTGKSGVDAHTLKGCLNSLSKYGMVREPTRGYFMRLPPSKPVEEPTDLDSLLDDLFPDQEPAATQEKEVAAPTQQEPTTMQTTKQETPIEKIGRLASTVQAMQSTLKQLASDIDTVAIEVEEMFSSRDAETAKLRQLQALLKSLGD